MQRLFAKLFLALMLILFVSARPAAAMPEIFPFEQLRSGMTGKAYTVVDGSGKIEQFNVKIVGVTDEGKGAKRMIMASASGEVIRRTGGILQGMSGSPVYIDGKLVGALAATLKEMDPYMFFITPIESMTEMWTLPDPKAQVNYYKFAREIETQESAEKNKDTATETQPTDAQSTDTQSTATTEKISDAKSAALYIGGFDSNGEKFLRRELLSSNDLGTLYVGGFDSNGEKFLCRELLSSNDLGTLYVGGFDSNGEKFLRRELQTLGIETFQSNVKTVERGLDLNATLEPGSALGVAIIYGDFSLGATGTVTAVDGKKILAFGHPFTHAGNVNYFMTDASVIGSVSGLTGNGVKLAGIGHIIGRVNQDRDAGIAGILGTFPAVVPITVTVRDTALDKEETFNATIAYNENLIPKLGASIAYTALSKMADSLAESTVDIDFNIKTDAVADGEIARKNMFYNSSDVGQVAVVELMQALNLVCSNTKAESNIFGVNVNIAFETDRRTASIVSITPDKKTVKPGDTVNLTIELQPYRKPTEKVILPYTVPFTARQGNLALEIHGGALVPVNQTAPAGIVTADSNQSYEDKIKALIKSGRNNQLVVEIGSPGAPKTEKELRREMEQAKRVQARLKKEGKSVKKADSKVDTNYIIDNVMRTTLSVEKV